MKKSIWISVSIVLVLCILVPDLLAQESEERRFSVTLHSGASYASDGQGSLGRLGGNFNVASARRTVFGGGFQYAFTPRWALEGTIQMGKFEGAYAEDPDFRNNFTTFSLRGVTNMNNLFNIQGGITNNVNPYLSIGMGVIHSNLKSEDLDYTGLALSLTGGAGLAFYLTPWSDLFLQYDYHVIGGDLLDGVSAPGGSDQFATLQGGIRINFGRGNARLASWHPPSPAPSIAGAPQDPAGFEEMQQRLEEHEEMISQLEVELDRINHELRAWLSGLESFLGGPVMGRFDILEEWQDDVESRIGQLEDESPLPESPVRALTEEPPAGHYIQVYSVPDRQTAEEIRENVISILGDSIPDPSRSVLIHIYRNYHRILIGGFESVARTRSVLPVVTGEYEDAFIITYPRQ